MTDLANSAQVRANHLFILDQIQDRLGTVNGWRRERTLSLKSVLSCIKDVVDGSEFSCYHGGTVAASYRQDAFTTFVMVSRVDDRIFLGITLAPAKLASPGRAWHELSPWKRGEGPTGDADKKFREWSMLPSVVGLTLDDSRKILDSEL